MRSSSTSGVASFVLLGTTATASLGHPASTRMRPSFSADTGVCVAGRTMMGSPDANAGATLCETRFSGKLNGVMPATGPSGTRRTYASRPSSPGSQSSATISPTMRLVSSAAILNVNAARSTSMRAVLIGLPASSAIVCAKSSRRAAMPALTASRISARFHEGSARVTRKAASASAMARSISRGLARCTSATRDRSKGLRTSLISPVWISRPPIRHPNSPSRAGPEGA